MDTNVNAQCNQMFWAYRRRDVACGLKLFSSQTTTANRYVVSKPSNSKWHVQTHICRREREMNSPKKIAGICFAIFDFCLVPK